MSAGCCIPVNLCASRVEEHSVGFFIHSAREAPRQLDSDRMWPHVERSTLGTLLLFSCALVNIAFVNQKYEICAPQQQFRIQFSYQHMQRFVACLGALLVYRCVLSHLLFRVQTRQFGEAHANITHVLMLAVSFTRVRHLRMVETKSVLYAFACVQGLFM